MWIKVCGFTSVDNTLEACAAGIDAIGLNFFAKSKRYVSHETAKAIVEAVPATVEPIGLFVNHSIEEIQQIVAYTGLKTVQLHGDETAEFAAQLNNLNIIRAIRIDSENIDYLHEVMQQYRQYGVKLVGCLVDANVAGSYGGTGHVAPWELIAEQYDYHNYPPLILAGGLSPENVAAAVRTVHPWGIDTASGVESAPGIKDRELVCRFVEMAKSQS